MSTEVMPDQACHVQCNFCNTILVVNIPCSNQFNIVTVRCGHCTNLLSVNLGVLLQGSPPQQDLQSHSISSQDLHVDHLGSSSRCAKVTMTHSEENLQLQTLPIRSPGKRQRVPSAYNKFIKDEIQRIKANDPEISHREAFSAAAKNWAHVPRIHFGESVESNKKV